MNYTYVQEKEYYGTIVRFDTTFKSIYNVHDTIDLSTIPITTCPVHYLFFLYDLNFIGRRLQESTILTSLEEEILPQYSNYDYNIEVYMNNTSVTSYKTFKENTNSIMTTQTPTMTVESRDGIVGALIGVFACTIGIIMYKKYKKQKEKDAVSKEKNTEEKDVEIEMKSESTMQHINPFHSSKTFQKQEIERISYQPEQIQKFVLEEDIENATVGYKTLEYSKSNKIIRKQRSLRSISAGSEQTNILQARAPIVSKKYNYNPMQIKRPPQKSKETPTFIENTLYQQKLERAVNHLDS